MKIADLYSLYIQYGLVDTDTRNIRKNTLFFALKGGNFNGNKFANDALIKGAKFAIVDEPEFKTSDAIILVEDVLKTLQRLASYHRKMLAIPIIAITGSNGKTTTKELINSVLSSKYNTTATKGNLNNHIGVPLTLLSMTKATEIGIVEMGANHPNEIAFLSEIIQPDYGYITNFGSAHLEGFGSIEGVVKAKSELYDYLIKNDKNIFINSNDAIQIEKTKNVSCNRLILFEKSLLFLEANPFVKLSFQETKIMTNLIGTYNFSNICVAISMGIHFEVSVEKIKKSLENYNPSNNRSQVIDTKNNKMILDAYNANPTSMKVALESFNNYSSNKPKSKVIILGDMFELGSYSAKEHQSIIDLAISFNFDTLFFVGENFYKTKTTKKHFKFRTFDELKKYIQENTLNDKIILVKGSRGMALERVIDFC